MNESRGWIRKFADAGRGLKIAVRGQVSFVFHFLATVAVVAACFVFQLSATRWCLVLLCIATVLVAEMFNTALEHLARAITKEYQPEIRDALDVASGGVLIASLGAAIVGLLVLGEPLLEWLR